jgi:hypothetical protein
MLEYPLRSNWNLELLIFTEVGKLEGPEKNPCGKKEPMSASNEDRTDQQQKHM